MTNLMNLDCVECGGKKTVECRPEHGVSECLKCGVSLTPDDLEEAGRVELVKAAGLRRYLRDRRRRRDQRVAE